MPRKVTQRRFPEIARQLNDAISEIAAQQGSRRRAFVVIATKLSTSVDAIDSWCRGARCIPEDKIEPLVRTLGHHTPRGGLTPSGLELITRLKAARKADEPILSWKERVDENRVRLRVQQAEYLGAGNFWGRAFFPFLDAAVIHHDTDRPSRNFDQLQHSAWCGDLDVALGVLATPRLSLKLWFFNSPIHYRLNCVALADNLATVGGVTRIQRILTLRRPDMRDNLLAPVVMRGEVGEAYALRNLALKHPIWVESLRTEEFCAKLTGRVREDGRIPLAFVDEITCLSILIELEGRGRLLFPLVPNAGDRRTIIPPSFPLGLCVSRNERLGHAKKSELMIFIRDALPSYIEGNARSIAFAYLALRDQMERLVEKALPDRPADERKEWVDRSFHLHPESLQVAQRHWRAVLLEAIAITQSKTRNTPAQLEFAVADSRS